MAVLVVPASSTSLNGLAELFSVRVVAVRPKFWDICLLVYPVLVRPSKLGRSGLPNWEDCPILMSLHTCGVLIVPARSTRFEWLKTFFCQRGGS